MQLVQGPHFKEQGDDGFRAVRDRVSVFCMGEPKSGHFKNQNQKVSEIPSLWEIQGLPVGLSCVGLPRTRGGKVPWVCIRVINPNCHRDQNTSWKPLIGWTAKKALNDILQNVKDDREWKYSFFCSLLLTDLYFLICIFWLICIVFSVAKKNVILKSYFLKRHIYYFYNSKGKNLP